MAPTARKSSRTRTRGPGQKLPERPRESGSTQSMAPTRMKLRVRRRDNTAAAGGGGPREGEEEEEVGRSRGSSRRNANKTSTVAATASSSPPASSASAQAGMAAEEASPDSKCPICLDRFNNLAYLDRCLHRFCFPCIQEWSHNKAECPLCKQPFASILHSVRAEDDFMEYTLRPVPANGSGAATVVMAAAMASAVRSDHQMRLMLRRHRVAGGGETAARRRRREQGGRSGAGSRRAEQRAGVWEWSLNSRLPPLPHQAAAPPVVAEEGDGEQRVRGRAEPGERGVIFRVTGRGGTVSLLGPSEQASRRLMSRLAARQRLQREGGTVRQLREREMVAFRSDLYRCGVRVRGVAGVNGNHGQQREVTAETFRNLAHLNRLRPWLQRELTVLYGAHGSLVDIVQHVIMARVARHGLEDTPTIEQELRPFLFARTEHFLHELVSFARSPLSLDSYDLQAVYEPPAAALELDGVSSSSESSSVIAISEGEEEERSAAGGSEVALSGTNDDIIQTGSCLSLSAWDDETPGPSYSTAEPSCSLALQSFSPAPQGPANEDGAEKQGAEQQEEEECLIVGYKKPIAERTPELVQLSSDTEEEKKKEEEEEPAEEPPPLPSTAPPLSYLPTIPPSTSGAFRDEQDDGQKEKDGEAGGRRSRARSWSISSGQSRNSVCTLSPATPSEGGQRRERGSWRDGKRSGSEMAREKRRRRKRRRRGRERSGTLYNPNRSIYPAMMRRRSPFHSSAESGSPPPSSPTDDSCGWNTSSVSSPSCSSPSSPFCPCSPLSSPPPTPSLSPSDRGNGHHGEKPGGKRKYKSRHLDSNVKDPTWRPRRREGLERKRRRGRERRRRDALSEGNSGESGRKSRDDRSPSVEIIYEGTVTADATHPPAHKRRRKHHRKTQHSSSPVIITLDSDSSHNDDVNNNNNNNSSSSSSSSPISSQQTVDFSDLPPLPLVHSAGVGGSLDPEIGDLPVDILDRGSDGSEAVGLITIDNSDVDVENDSGSLRGFDDDDDDTHGPIREARTNDKPRETRSAPANQVPKPRPHVSTSDRLLLATIINDLKGFSAPTCDLTATCEASCSADTGMKRYGDLCEVGQRHRNLDVRLAEEQLSGEGPDPNQDVDLLTGRTSIPSPPPLERWAGEEGGDVPPLLRQASPIRLHNRDTPPPLKHKDAGSPRRGPAPPTGLHSAGLYSDPGESHLVNDKHAIPPISTLKRRFTSASALRGEVASTSITHEPPADPRPFSGFGTTPSMTHVDLTSFNSSQTHSSSDGTTSSPVDSHPVSSLSLTDFHSANCGWSKQTPAHRDSTSTGCGNKTPGSCQVAPVALHPSGGAAEGTPGDRSVFSGVNSNDPSPPGFLSPVDPRTLNPPSPVDPRTLNPPSPVDPRTLNPPSPVDPLSSGKRDSVSLSGVDSDPAAAPSGRLSPTDLDPGSSKSTIELFCSQTETKTLSVADHEDGSPQVHLPPIDLHCTSLVPPANFHPARFDGHFRHAALSPPGHAGNFHPSQRKGCSLFTAGPPSKLLRSTDNHLEPVDSEHQPPVDSPSKHRQMDFLSPRDNHMTPESTENQRDSNTSPMDARSNFVAR